MNQADSSTSSPEHRRTVTDVWLWFGVLGGAIAWLLHLLFAYSIAEFGCASSFHETRWLGFSGVAWLEALLSFVMLAIAIFASVVAKRNGDTFAGPVKATRLEDPDPRVFMARSGVLASRLFVLTIAVQSVPILYYLREC